MSILTEKEREDVYKYWLHSSTLTNEDGLIQLAERAVLEKLAGMELPWGDDIEAWLEVKTGSEIAAAFRQAYAQGAASQLSAEPVAWFDVCMESAYTEKELDCGPVDGLTPLYALKTIK